MTSLPPYLFISDIHLDRVAATQLVALKQFLSGLGRAGRVFILGDLFDYWIGDDAALNQDLELADSLRQLPTPPAFQHGNRDFLLGAAFAERAGLELLPEEQCLEGPAGPMLLLHGDSLCTDDVEYQHLRVMLRNRDWQQQFLARPVAERRYEAELLRQRSREAMQTKTADIMDVHPDAVAEAFRRHQVTLMIHGHTHRPGVTRMTVDGQVCSRWVLPSWDDIPGYLWLDADGPQLRTLDDQPYPLD